MTKVDNHFCKHCLFNDICLPLGLSAQEMQRLETLIHRSHVQQKGSIAIHQGKVFQKIYAVKSGMYKSTRVDAKGHEWVIGFNLPGEIIGLDAIYNRTYLNTTTALTTSSLCALDFDTLSKLSASIPALQKQIMRLLSKDIDTLSDISLSLTAEQRLTSFIHSLLHRLHVRGYTIHTLELPMSKQDIARHLGIAPETLSRLLKRLQKASVIKVNNHTLTVVNKKALLELTGLDNHPQGQCTKNYTDTSLKAPTSNHLANPF